MKDRSYRRVRPHPRVLCLGSAHGDDQVAWFAAERLQALSPALDVRLLSSPLQLLDTLPGCKRAILVDAAVADGHQLQPGRILEFLWPDARLQALDGISSHGFSAPRVLALAERLGRLPAHVHLLAVAGGRFEAGRELSPSVASALRPLVDRVLLLVADADHGLSGAVPGKRSTSHARQLG